VLDLGGLHKNYIAARDSGNPEAIVMHGQNLVDAPAANNIRVDKISEWLAGGSDGPSWIQQTAAKDGLGPQDVAPRSTPRTSVRPTTASRAG
jgi:hypothetical protein